MHSLSALEQPLELPVELADIAVCSIDVLHSARGLLVSDAVPAMCRSADAC